MRSVFQNFRPCRIAAFHIRDGFNQALYIGNRRARCRRFISFQSSLVNQVVQELGKARRENVEIDISMYRDNHGTS